MDPDALDRIERLEAAYRDALVERELMAAICRHPVVPYGAAQLVKLWRDEMYALVDEGGGEIAVFKTDGGLRAKTVVDERLASPEYAHFLTHKA